MAEGLQRDAIPTPALVCVLIGAILFCSAKWSALADISDIAMVVIYIARFTEIITYAAVAVIFYNRLPPIQSLLRLIAVFMILSIVGLLAEPLFQGDILGAVVLCVTGVPRGIVNALFMLLYAYAFTRTGARLAAILFCLTQLVTNCFMLMFSLLDPMLLLVVRVSFFAASTVALMVGMRLLPSLHDDTSLSEAMSEEKITDSTSVSTKVKHRENIFPTTWGEWIVLLIMVATLHNLFGMIAQSSSLSANNFALYDVAINAITIVMGILLLVYLCIKESHVNFEGVFAVVVPLYLLGFALYPALWPEGNPLAGALVRVGYDWSTVLTLALIARKAAADPAHSFFYFGLFRAFSSCYPGRFVGSIIAETGGMRVSLCVDTSLAALAIIGIFAVLAFLFAYRSYIGPVGKRNILRTPLAIGADDAFLVLSATHSLNSDFFTTEQPESKERVSDFTLRFEALSCRLQLSEREREVLSETLHGYSRTSVAEKLCLSTETVKSYLKRIYLKAGVNSKQELIALVEKESLPQ